MFKWHVSMIGAAGGILLSAFPAFAQPQSSEVAYTGIDKIVVTARKREESIMKVPVVATALDEEQLQRFEANDLRRVADQVPGLLVGEGASASYGNQLSLRGVGTSTNNTTIDQSVALNIDGQQFTHGLAYTAGMFDLAQITVLKGPQALFFGKASPAGVIAIRTADPTPEFEVIARAGYETDARTEQTDLIVSGPVTDTLGLRIAGRYNDSSGYFRNVAEPVPGTGALAPEYSRRQNSSEALLRGTALWQPLDEFSAKLKVTYSNKKKRGLVSQFVSCPDGTAGPIGIPFIGDDDCTLNRDYSVVDLDPDAFIGIENNGVPFADVEQKLTVLELNYDVTDAITLTSVSGYFDVNQTEMFNGNSSGGAGPSLSAATDYERRDITQEIRLASAYPDSPVNFTLGAFFEKTDQRKFGNARGNQALFVPLPVLLSDHKHDNPARAESVFGQLLWQTTPMLELGAGVRWTHEEREHRFVNYLAGPELVPLAVPKLSSNKVSPELSLTYTPTDDITVFAALKKGYKSGSHNSSGSIAPGHDSSFRDETVEGGEIGLKSRFLDRSLTFNIAGYYYDYGDLQVGASTQSTEGLIVTRTLNAASASVYGIEMDTTYFPRDFEGLTLRAAANWNHARYDKFKNAPCWGGQLISEACNRVIDPSTGLFTAQDLSGRPLLRSPDYSASFGFDYEQPIGEALSILFATNVQYSSKYYAETYLREDSIQSKFVKINANISLSGPDDKWQLSLIGNNLTNKLVRNRCSSSNAANGAFLGGIITGGTMRGFAGVDELVCSVDSGRELWLRASVRF